MINKDFFPSIKVYLAGDSGVGKFDIIPMVTKSPGSIFITKTMQIDQNQFIKFDIWDTAGKERYRSLSKLYYKKSDVIIMVYDITIKESFDNLKKFWIELIKENRRGYVGEYINI